MILIVLWPASAFAHVQQGAAAGFLTGFVHPISGLDHVLAMVAVGLWGAQLGAPAIWVLPVAFPLVMAMGGMLGLMGVPVPGIEYGIAASAILLGAAVTVRSARFALRDRVAGRGLRHLPWPRAWNRTPARSERLALQHGLRDRDRVFACAGNRHRRRPPMDMGPETAARRRRRGRGRWCLFHVEGVGMKRLSQSRLPTCGIVTLAVAAVFRAGRSTPQFDRHGTDL